MQSSRNSPEQAWLVHARRKRRPGPGAPPAPDLLAELSSLVEAAGGVVAGVRSQTMESENPATLIGAGTVRELAETVREHGVDLVVFQNLLRPNQQANLEEQLGVKVLDRREVILDIFARRARTLEGKLQVELAQLSFRIGRLIGGRRDLSRLGGGIGTRGPGEKKLEEDRRRIRTQIRRIERQLATVRRTRSLQYRRRKEVGFPVVALVGYTNAGKSTLLARISRARPKIADYPFTTLSPVLGVVTHRDEEFVVADLPGLIEGAHRGAGLGHRFLKHAERTEALVHVLDASHPAGEIANACRTVREEMERFHPGLARRPTLLAFNKMDLPGARRAAEKARAMLNFPEGDAYYISAVTGKGVFALLDALVALRRRPTA